MEEIEVPTEHLQETLHEEAHKPPHERHSDPFTMRIALSSAMIAVLAAVAALLAGHHANEAVIEQLQASDQWSLYQAKSIKATMLASTGEVLRAVGKQPPTEDLAKLEKYRQEQESIDESAREKERASREHLSHHQILARSVTLFQVGIAMAAIGALTRRRNLWLVSMVLGLLGVGFFVQGLI